jgi:hypothetical protein
MAGHYVWVLERSLNAKFPYRLQILEAGNLWLALRVQDRWPGANQNIFCLRESEPPAPDEALEEVERVDLIALQRRGPRLSVVLDRARRKRCDFLFLSRSYKNRPSVSYEQIFWQTQQSMRQRRPSVRLATNRQSTELAIRIASDERYPWRFTASQVSRGRLSVGDYALWDEGRPVAVVERKTFDNLLADFGAMPVLHQRLLELAAQEQHAFVVEAAYEDFLNPKKLHHYSPTFCAAAIAELYASHPRLRIVFCANRKTANAWVQQYFSAVWAVISNDNATHVGMRQKAEEEAHLWSAQ